MVWRHGPPLRIRHFERNGVVHEEVSEVLRVVSPLALEPPRAEGAPLPLRRRRRPPRARRPGARSLAPLGRSREIVWYQGGHVTFRFHPEVRRLVDGALAESGLLGGDGVH